MEDKWDRWHPDEQLVAAVLAGSAARMSDLNDSDRAWVVAGLMSAHLTAEDIADRLGCSLRLVRAIRALPLTAVCLYALQESANFTDELRLAQAGAAGLGLRLLN